MKSFFKKLAFVMALAMVVSLAAPAAANAATTLVAALQGTTAKVESLTLTTGEEIDLCFIGAPQGWRNLERGWKVTNGDAVTVDQNGVIKAVKAGEATVEFYMEGCESAVVTVKVEDKKEGYLGYTQTSTNTVQFGFGSSVAGVKQDDVTLYRVFETVQGDVEVYWPIETFKAADNTITVSPFVMFGDGEQYRIKINGETYDFVTVLPELSEITYVQTTFGTDAAASNGKAEVSDEDNDYECEINLGYKLMYNTMDVTALFSDLVDIEFVLVSPDPNSDADILDEIYLTDSTLILTDKVDVVVKATAVYDDEDGNTVEILSIPATIAPEKKGAYDFKAVVDWCLYSGSGDVNWDTKSVPAGAEGYTVILLVEDTYGDLYVTNSAAVNATKGYQAIEDSRFEKAGFTFKFYSTNTDLFLIGETDPEVTTYKEANLATVYVALHQDTEEEDDKFIGNKYAFSFKITEPAKLNKFTVSSSSIKVLADATVEDLVTNYVTITAQDQNGATWKESFTFDVTVASGTKTIEDLPADAWSIESKENGTTIVTVNGAVLYAATGKTSFKVTVKEVNSGLTTSFSVSLTKPNWKDRKTEYAYTNFEEGIVSATKDEYITGADQTDVNKLYTILIDQEDKQNKLTIETATAKLTKKTATVTLYKTSNGEKVGYHDATTFERSNPSAWKDATAEVGDRFYALYFNGKVVNEKDGMYAITTTENGKLNITFATKAEDGKMTYATAGTYTLSIYTVTAVDADGKITKYATKSADIKVTDDRKSVALNTRTKISTTLTDEADIVLDAFSFTLGGKTWTPDETVIGSVDYTTNGQYMIIKSVTFKVPVDGGKNLTDGEEYYTQKVTVNMSVKLAD